MTAFLANGCELDNPNQLLPSDDKGGAPNTSGEGGAGGGVAETGGETANGGSQNTNSATATNAGTDVLSERVLSFAEALRTASFKLVGNAPTLQEMTDLDSASDAEKPQKYAQLIDEMMNRPAFRVRMVEFWQSAFRMKGGASGPMPSRNTAPVFAARVTVEGLPFSDLLLASSNTCPTFNEETATFEDGNCNNGITPVGILTDPGIHSLYYGNMAFRRTRFFHEAFLCKDAMDPVAETGQSPGSGGPVGYVSPWPWASIAGGPNATVDFLNGSGVICANCHATWNHRAVLWANFDAAGQYQQAIAVHAPIAGLPMAVRDDFLPSGEPTAWKFNSGASSLTPLGTAMANDPEVQSCAVARMWNYAMSRGDIVETGNKVASEAIAKTMEVFQSENQSLRAVLRAILLSDDFVRF